MSGWAAMNASTSAIWLVSSAGSPQMAYSISAVCAAAGAMATEPAMAVAIRATAIIRPRRAPRDWRITTSSVRGCVCAAVARLAPWSLRAGRPDVRTSGVILPRPSSRTAQPPREPLRLRGDDLVGEPPRLLQRETGLDLGVLEHRVVDGVPILVSRGVDRQELRVHGRMDVRRALEGQRTDRHGPDTGAVDQR